MAYSWLSGRQIFYVDSSGCCLLFSGGFSLHLVSALLEHNKPQNKYLFFVFLPGTGGLWNPNQQHGRSKQRCEIESDKRVFRSLPTSPKRLVLHLNLLRTADVFFLFFFSSFGKCIPAFFYPSVVYLILCEGWCLLDAVIRLFPLRNITAKLIH